MLKPITFLVLLVCMAVALAIPPVADVTYANPLPLPDGEPAGTYQGDGDVLYCSPIGNSPIPDDNGNGITSVINVPDDAQITDVNVVLSVTHTYMGDLYIALTNDATTRDLLDRPQNGNCSGNNLDDNISDDEAGASFETDCSYTSPAYVPGAAYYSGRNNDDPLEAFDNRSTVGDWTLTVQDRGEDETGALRQWCLQFTVLGPTPTPSATPTEPPLPTNTPTPTPTNTPDVPPTVTPTPTITPTPDPDTRFTYLASTLSQAAAGTCQSVEAETLYPNNTIGEARSTRPLCRGQVFQGIHNTPDNREDIFRFVVGDDAAGLYAFALDVPDINLSLRLYDNEVNELAFSTNPDTQDEQFERTLTPGTYFVRVYRADEVISEQPYRLTIMP